MLKKVLAVIGLLIPALAQAQYAPVSVNMPVKQVAPHSYYVMGLPGMATDFEGFISNAGFVITDEGVVVFDALGTPSLAWKLRQQIRTLTDKPVVKVIISHYHADHIYGIQVFQDEGAEIIAPKGAYEYLDLPVAEERLDERRFSLEPWVNENTRLVVPDKMIDQPMSFSLGGIDFELSYLGSAHSTGDLVMYVKQDATLYSGDIIFEGRVPYVGDADTKHWLTTLERLETGQLKALVPGHGPAAKKPQEAVSMTRRYLAKLREVMGVAIEDLMDFASAFDAADWHEFSHLPAFEAAHRRNAYQTFLSMEAEVLTQD